MSITFAEILKSFNMSAMVNMQGQNSVFTTEKSQQFDVNYTGQTVMGEIANAKGGAKIDGAGDGHDHHATAVSNANRAAVQASNDKIHSR